MMDILIVILIALGILIAMPLATIIFILIFTILDSDYGWIIWLPLLSFMLFYAAYTIGVETNLIEPFLPFLPLLPHC